MVVADSVAAVSDLETAEYGTAARAAGAERVSADRRLETRDILSLVAEDDAVAATSSFAEGKEAEERSKK